MSNETEKKKHILVVSQYFYPEEFRINDICMEWMKRGYQVTVLTGIPNYPQGKFYRGYNWFKGRTENYEGIHIIRIPLIPRGNNSFMLALNYFSFVFSGFFWQLFTQVKADKVFIFEVSPMTQALIGVWFAKRRKIPCYIYVQDLWPENVEIVAGIHNKIILHAIDRMVDYIYARCDKVFATSPSFVKRLEERESVYCFNKTTRNAEGKTGQSKVFYWPQYAEEFYRPEQRTALVDVEDDENFKIVFTGNIGYAQGLEILPKAAKILKEKNITCRFYIIGEGRYREQFEDEIKKQDVQDMFRLLGHKKPTEIPKYMAHFNAAFLSFSDNPLFEMTIPAKLQSYMACGMPIIAAAGGESKRIIEEAQCGFCCDLGNINELAIFIEKLINLSEEERKQMVENALKYSKEYFNKDKLLNEFECYW